MGRRADDASDRTRGRPVSFLIDLGLSFYGLLFAHWLWKTGRAERLNREWTPDDEDSED